jgi:hypothetical protein
MDDRCGRRVDDGDDLDGGGGGGVRDGWRSLLSAKSAAYGENLALERRLKRKRMRCLRLGVNPPVFKRDVIDGRRCDSPRVRDVKLLGSPRATDASRSRIHQRRPNT